MWDPLADEMLFHRPFAMSLLSPRASAPGLGGANLPVSITPTNPVTINQNVVRGSSIAMGSLADSARFNGTNAAYARTDNAIFSSHAGASGKISIVQLVRLRAYGAQGGWFASKWNVGAGAPTEFTIGFLTTGAPFVIFATSVGVTVMTITSTKILALGRPYLIGVDYDRAAPRLSLFINGAEETTTTASGVTADTAAAVGFGQRSDGTRWYNGDASHLGYFPRPLGRGVHQQLASLALNGRTESPYAA